MVKCPICSTNEADKKNVHLIPWFLIKNWITKEGTGVRDMELSFSINPNSFTKMFAGQSILPETIEEFGELSDLERETKNPYSIDNLLCGKCEDKLSRLEAIFAAQFNQRKLAAAYQAKSKTVNGQVLLNDHNYSYDLYDLLIQSIFYRCSIGRFDGFRLNSNVELKIEENLRTAFLYPDFKKIKLGQKIGLKYNFSVITAMLHIPEGEDVTRQFIVANKSRYPYFIRAGKWLFQLYELEKHLKNPCEWLYGLSSQLISKDAFSVTRETAHVILLSEKSSNFITNNVIEHFAVLKIAGTNKQIKDLYVHIFKHSSTNYIASYIYSRYLYHLNVGKNEFACMVHAFLDLKLLP